MEVKALSKSAGTIQMLAAETKGPWSKGFAAILNPYYTPSYVTLGRDLTALSLTCHICKMGMPASRSYYKDGETLSTVPKAWLADSSIQWVTAIATQNYLLHSE